MSFHGTSGTLMSVLASIVFLGSVSGCRPESIKLANEYIDIKMYDQAESLLREELKRNPDSAPAHFALGRCLLEAGKDAEAGREFDKSVMINKGLTTDVSKAYLELATRLFATGGDVKRAVGYLTRVVTTSQDMAGDIAEVCREQAASRAAVPGGADDTILLFDTALEFAPKLAEKVADDSFQAAGKVAGDDGEAAARYAEYAMAGNPRHAKRVAKLYREMAIAAYDGGDDAAARRYAGRAVEINADFADDKTIRKVLVSKDMDVNLRAAVAVLKKIVVAQQAFADEHDGRYANVEQLYGSAAAAGLDAFLSTMTSDGYTFEIAVSDIGANFYAMAKPTEYERTGLKSLFVDGSGTVRGGDLNGKMPSPVPGNERYGENLEEIGAG